MKNAFAMIAILATLLISVACAKELDNVYKKESEAAEKVAATPKSVDPPKKVYSEMEKAELLRKAKTEQIERLKSEYEETFKQGWKAELKGSNYCILVERRYEIYSFISSIEREGASDGGEYFTLSYAEVGISEQVVKAEMLKNLKALTASVVEIVSHGTPLKSCGGGESEIDLSDQYQLVESLIQDLDEEKLKPEDVGLTTAKIREMLLKSAINEIAKIKKGQNSYHLQSIIEEYGFTAKELKITEEEFASYADKL